MHLVMSLVFIDRENRFLVCNAQDCVIKPILGNRCESRWSRIGTGYGN